MRTELATNDVLRDFDYYRYFDLITDVPDSAVMIAMVN